MLFARSGMRTSLKFSNWSSRLNAPSATATTTRARVSTYLILHSWSTIAVFSGARKQAAMHARTQKQNLLKSFHGLTILWVTFSVSCDLIVTEGRFLCTSGYYAVGTKVDFVVITRPPSAIAPLFGHDLRYKKERVANLVHRIRLCSVIPWMDKQFWCCGRSVPDFVPF